MNGKTDVSLAAIRAARQRTLQAFRRAFDAIGPDDMQAEPEEAEAAEPDPYRDVGGEG